MAFISGTVYQSPKEDFPHLAVIFNPDGKVLDVRAVTSIEAGEKLLHQTLTEFAEKLNLDVKEEFYK